VGSLGSMESTLKYRSWKVGNLMTSRESGSRTVSDGQFDWGGILLKSNGGVQSFSHRGWQSRVERKGIREVNCETNKSSRYESRA
jgi:hypothetical protein